MNKNASFQVEHKELLEGASRSVGAPAMRRRRRRASASSSNNSTLSEAAAIQQSFGRTQSLLQNELERVAQVSVTIETDGKILEETMNDHKTMNVSKAKSALTALQRAQNHEQRVLLLSIAFFGAVVFYVLWCRVLIRVPFLDTILYWIRNLFVNLPWLPTALASTFKYIRESTSPYLQVVQEAVTPPIESATEMIYPQLEALRENINKILEQANELVSEQVSSFSDNNYVVDHNS